MPSAPTPYSTLRRKVITGFSLVSAMLAIVAGISIYTTREFIRAAEFAAQSHEAIETQERLLRNVMLMESIRRGFLVTNDATFLRGYEDAQTEAIQSFNALKPLAAGSPSQQARHTELHGLLQRSFALQQEEIQIERLSGHEKSAERFGKRDTENVVGKIRRLVIEGQGEQRELLAHRTALTDNIGRATTAAVVAGAALTAVALITAAFLILRDLAARRRAEEALAQEHNLLFAIIHELPSSVYVKDVKGRYILDNNAHRRYLGLDEAHLIEGNTDSDYFAEEVARRFELDDREVIQTGKSIHRDEPASLRGTPAERRWLDTNKVPLRDTDGAVVGVIGISSDITERKKAEERLKRFAGQLERSNAELQSFASVASHDLQEPLRKIRAFGDRLQAKCGPQLGEQGLDYLARMQNAAQRMQTLIQDLLKLSRVTSRAQPFERCSLDQIVREVLTDLEVLIEQTQAKVEISGLPTINADPLQMRMLFQNLISNAIKFHKPGEDPLVRITGRMLEGRSPAVPGGPAPGREYEIRVADNGIGFDEKFAEQIFAVFQRLHSREEYEGTGIGLAVCRKITDRHGGSIVAQSTAGEGAAFIVTLPAAQIPATVHE